MNFLFNDTSTYDNILKNSYVKCAWKRLIIYKISTIITNFHRLNDFYWYSSSHIYGKTSFGIFLKISHFCLWVWWEPISWICLFYFEFKFIPSSTDFSSGNLYLINLKLNFFRRIEEFVNLIFWNKIVVKFEWKTCYYQSSCEIKLYNLIYLYKIFL